jgi:hypothetical protein
MRGGSNLASEPWISPKLCRKVTDVTCLNRHFLPCDVLRKALVPWRSHHWPRTVALAMHVRVLVPRLIARIGTQGPCDTLHRLLRCVTHSLTITATQHAPLANGMHAVARTTHRCMTIAAQLLLSAALLMSRFASHRSSFALGTSHAST